MQEVYDQWNIIKQELQYRNTFLTKRGEVFWANVGLNVGVEMNGKSDNFKRPILIIKVFNQDMVLAVPLTSQQKNGPHHAPITLNGNKCWACLTQVRVMSTKRLIRKSGFVSQSELEEVINRFKHLL